MRGLLAWLNVPATLARLERKLDLMALDLTALNAAVTAETTVDQSVETLLTTLAAELATANDAGDQAAIAQIVTTMQQNAATLGAAVTANTPAPAVAAPAPEPAPAEATPAPEAPAT